MLKLSSARHRKIETPRLVKRARPDMIPSYRLAGGAVMRTFLSEFSLKDFWLLTVAAALVVALIA